VLLEHEPATDEWHVVWWDAHYLGDQATNNVAEHTALWRGVVECTRRYGTDPVHLTIIGDSALVLGHVTGTALSKTRHMTRLTRRTTTALSPLSNVRFRHTLRTGNKMADYLANCAMDARSHDTSAGNWTDRDTALSQLLHNDLNHATTQPQRPLALLPELTLLLHTHETRAATSRKRKRTRLP
jgi:ribonuclease HI